MHGLTSWKVCTETEHLQEGFRSFPSGHSSFAWTGMWYLTLFLSAKMRALNRKGYTIKSWILLAPITGATLVSVSRTMDYRHHATDVIAGGIVGVLAAWWGYRQYFPVSSTRGLAERAFLEANAQPIAAPKSWKTYDPRIKNPESAIPLHTVHERDVSDPGMGLVNTQTSYPSPPGVVYPPQRMNTPYSPISAESTHANVRTEYSQRLE